MILLSLSGCKETYGYEIITELNSSASVLGYAKEGTIYRILYRLQEAELIQCRLATEMLMADQKISVCRTDKIPLGTKGRTSILSVESSASCGASFSVSRRKLHDRECCVTSFRQGGYTPLRR